MSSTVTIDKAHFDLLLRKGFVRDWDFKRPDTIAYVDLLQQYIGKPENASIAKESNTVTIFKSLHDELIRQAREYRALRQTLMAGGISEETLNLLVSPASHPSITPPPGLYTSIIHTTSTAPRPSVNVSPDFWPGASKDSVDLSANAPSFKFGENSNLSRQDWRPVQPSAAGVKPAVAIPTRTEPMMEKEDDMSSIGDPAEEQYEAVDHQPRRGYRRDHTLLFSKLPVGVTHAEVTSVVMGGRLIHIWVRRDDRSANVTFAEGAGAFLAYAKRNDIYINNKRIEVSWSDWQFKPHRNLLNKLGQGVSRNMVIRNALNRISEEEIREHMEHIHNLVICQFVWKDNSAYISTNSIIGAYSARQCLHTRKQYKGLKIDWYPDECDVVLPFIEHRFPQPPSPIHLTSPRKTVQSTSNVNRFNLLSLESSSDVVSVGESVSASSRSGIMLRPRSSASNKDDE